MDMLTEAILGVLGSAAVELVVKHWREIAKWVKDIFVGIKNIFLRIAEGIYYAIKAYVELLTSKVAAFRNRLVYQENYYFVEEIRERRVDVGSLPAWARRSAVLGQENEVTNEVRDELHLVM